MREYRDEHAIDDVWQASERVLVCIGPNAMAEPLIRAGKRLASAIHADWIVAYVETPELQRMAADARDGILNYLRLAEELGAETAATLSAGHERGNSRSRAQAKRNQDRAGQTHANRLGALAVRIRGRHHRARRPRLRRILFVERAGCARRRATADVKPQSGLPRAGRTSPDLSQESLAELPAGRRRYPPAPRRCHG